MLYFRYALKTYSSKMTEYQKLYQLYEAIQKHNIDDWQKMARAKDFSKLISIPIPSLSEKEHQNYLDKLSKGKKTSVEERLKAGFCGTNPLIIASEMGELSMVESILHTNRELIHKTNLNGDNPLHLLSKTRVKVEDEEDLGNFSNLVKKLIQTNPSLLLQKNNLGLTPVELFAITNREHLRKCISNQLSTFSTIIPDYSKYKRMSAISYNALRNFVIEKFIRDTQGISTKKLSDENLQNYDLRTLGQHYGFEFDNNDDMEDVFQQIKSKALSYQSPYPPTVLLTMNLQKNSNPLMTFINYQMRQSLGILPHDQQQLVLSKLEDLYDALNRLMIEKNAKFFDKKQIVPIVEQFLKSIKGLDKKHLKALKETLSSSISQKNANEAEELIKRHVDRTFLGKVKTRTLYAPARLTPQKFLTESDAITSDILVEGKNLQQLDLVAFMQAVEKQEDLNHYFESLVQDIIDTPAFKSASIEQQTKFIEKYLSYFFDHIQKLYTDKKMASEFLTKVTSKTQNFIQEFAKSKLAAEHNELLKAYLDLHDPDNFYEPFSSTNFYRLVHNQSEQWLKVQIQEFDEPMQKSITQYFAACKNPKIANIKSYEIGLLNAISNIQNLMQHITKNIVSDETHMKAKGLLIKQLNKLVLQFNSKIQGHEDLAQEFKKYFVNLNYRISELSPEKLTHKEYEELKEILHGINQIERKIQALNALGQSADLSNIFQTFIDSQIVSTLRLDIFQNFEFLNLVNQQLQTEVCLVERRYLNGIIEKLASFNEPVLDELVTDLTNFKFTPEDYERCINSFEKTISKLEKISIWAKLNHAIRACFGVFQEIEKPIQSLLKQQINEFRSLAARP